MTLVDATRTPVEDPDREYDDWYDKKLALGEEQTLAPWHIQAIPFLPKLDGLRVLDMGSGVGTFSRYLAERGAIVTAADFSPKAIEYAQQRILSDLPNADAIVADIHEIPFADETFDLTVCSSVLEHVVDPNKAISELVRVTRRGGTILLLLPNYMSLKGLYRGLARLAGKQYREIDQPINHPLLLPVVAWKFRRRGCKITAIDSVYHVLLFPFIHKRLIFRWLEHPWLRPASRWFGLHALIRATRK